MSDTFQQILLLIRAGEIRISEHGYDELTDDGIRVKELIDGIGAAAMVEDYPDFHKGPCVLVLQRTQSAGPVHVVWGIPKGYASPAVLVTAYRPDADRWTSDFMRRKQ